MVRGNEHIPGVCGHGSGQFRRRASARRGCGDAYPALHIFAKEKETPSGYATADPILFEITDTGHLEKIHQVVMKDEPLSLVVSKNTITGGKEVAGAKLGIYPVDEEGTVSEKPLLLHIPEEEGRYRDEEAVWITGLDVTYTKEEKEKVEIPEGFVVGD